MDRWLRLTAIVSESDGTLFEWRGADHETEDFDDDRDYRSDGICVCGDAGSADRPDRALLCMAVCPVFCFSHQDETAVKVEEKLMESGIACRKNSVSFFCVCLFLSKLFMNDAFIVL